MKMVQIRNVPDDVHRRLKARAALEGRSLSEFALAELRRSLERPTRTELLERLQAREHVSVSEPAADAVRAERDAVIVLDASAAVELVLRLPLGGKVAQRLADPDEAVHAPHLLGVEVAQVVRRYVHRGELGAQRAVEALGDFADLDVVRHPHEPLLLRMWHLRDDLTAYDATYVALAEALDAPLLTLDAGLANAPGHDARVELVP